MAANTKTLAEARSWCVLAYLVAACAGAAVWLLAPIAEPFWRMAAADVVATVVIFGFSLGLNNSSMYDPYWSVAPVLIAAGWSAHPQAIHGDPLRQLMVMVLIGLWGARLTLNWGRHWRGLGHEDWRYVDMRHSTGRAYWLVSFAGLHMFPTAMVLLNLWAVYTATFGSRPFALLDLLAASVTALAIVIETFADRQLHAFVARNRDPQAFLQDGLWAYSRHPNYFGEVTFWWGLSLFALAAQPAAYGSLAGPVAMTLMFWFVSIPMIDKRMLKKRPRYGQHMRLVSRLVPWLPGAPPPLGSPAHRREQEQLPGGASAAGPPPLRLDSDDLGIPIDGEPVLRLRSDNLRGDDLRGDNLRSDELRLPGGGARGDDEAAPD